MAETIKTSAMVNYRSDFNLILRLRSHDGSDIGFPSYDWEARFHTGLRAYAFVASCRGGVCENCFNDGGRVRVVFDNHHLSRGELQVEFTAYLPNDDYSDGAEKIAVPASLGIELTREAAPCPTALEAEMVLPYIKGDKGDKGEKGDKGDRGEPFRYDDFTAEQIAELQKPAADAAKQLRTLSDEVSARETTRESNERARKAAEERRAAEFAGFKDAIDGKAEKFSTSEDLRLENNVLALTDRAKQRLFDDLWRQAWGGDGGIDEAATDGRRYLGNGLAMTYGEAVEVMMAGRLRQSYSLNGDTVNQMFYRNKPIRTCLPPYQSDGHYYTAAAYAFMGCRQIEVINLPNLVPFTLCFLDCRKLHTLTVKAPVVLSTGENARIYEGCVSLVNLRCFYTFKADIYLQWSPLLSLESLANIVAVTPADVAQKGGFTVTVHPDVYAKLTDGALPEWGAVLTDALAKNITFATI